MGPVAWRDEFNIGIDAIDNQHRRILDYINDLGGADAGDRQQVGKVILALLDYTETHFRFEESLMERAGYGFSRAHHRVHQLFIRKLCNYQARHHAGENVGPELQDTLVNWLLRHIHHEDRDYASAVHAYLESHPGESVAPEA